jgi:hypothetical protein
VSQKCAYRGFGRRVRNFNTQYVVQQHVIGAAAGDLFVATRASLQRVLTAVVGSASIASIEVCRVVFFLARVSIEVFASFFRHV